MDWHTEWLAAARRAAQVRKSFWRSQRRRSSETRLVFLVGDSILNGDEDATGFHIVDLFNWLAVESGAVWQAAVIGGDNADVLYGAMDVLLPQTGDIAILQDCGPRSEQSQGVRALWTARALLVRQFGTELALMTSACGSNCPIHLDWNTPLPPDGATANDAVRAVAQMLEVPCFDFQYIAANAGLQNLFADDGVHLAPTGAIFLSCALLAFITGHEVSEQHILAFHKHQNLKANRNELISIHRAISKAACVRMLTS
ncbi:SGNH/GDSL hydrolase family protein [Hyphomonas sp.]|uniref:SGNH/GDSL hydrolase family protein n=1 Tax=Hyphomonas sp. TaxID=87 RepID=UPI001BCB7CFA|nr:SGNH/GDSL hydrolase family protein [Hyphomonas sp.]